MRAGGPDEKHTDAERKGLSAHCADPLRLRRQRHRTHEQKTSTRHTQAFPGEGNAWSRELREVSAKPEAPRKYGAPQLRAAGASAADTGTAGAAAPDDDWTRCLSVCRHRSATTGQVPSSVHVLETPGHGYLGTHGRGRGAFVSNSKTPQSTPTQWKRRRP